MDQDDWRIARVTELLKVEANPVNTNEMRVCRMFDGVGHVVPIDAARARQHLDRDRGPDRSRQPQCKIPEFHRFTRDSLAQNDLRLNHFLSDVVIADRYQLAAR